MSRTKAGPLHGGVRRERSPADRLSSLLLTKLVFLGGLTPRGDRCYLKWRTPPAAAGGVSIALTRQHCACARVMLPPPELFESVGVRRGAPPSFAVLVHTSASI